MNALECYINNTIRKEDNSPGSLGVEIIKVEGKTVLGVVYRPPNTSNDNLVMLWQEINQACGYNQVCILGNFNLRNKDLDLNIGDKEAKDFLKIVQDNSLRQVVREPTKGNRTLDLILTNSDDLI